MNLLNKIFVHLPVKIRKWFDDAKEGFDAQMRITLNTNKPLSDMIFVAHDELSGRSFNVYCSDDIVCVSGMPSRLPGAVACHGIEDNDEVMFIIVNTTLLLEPQWFIDGIIKHEIGHIILHTDQPDKLGSSVKEILSFQYNKYEFEADDYANQQHDMLRILRRLYEVGYDVRERIDHLTKN